MKRALASLAAAISPALFAAPTHADPSLPAGWIAGGPPSTMSAESVPSPRSLEALQLASAPLRPALAPVPVALDALDLVDVAPTLTEREVEASNATPVGESPTDLFIDRGCQRASVSGHAVGEIQIGWISRPIGPQSTRGVALWHVRGSGGGDGRHVYARARWETIDHLPDGTLRYTQTVGRFNVLTCKTTVASRYTAIARPILGGLAFAFRTRCAACNPAGREELHLITPSSGWGTDEYAHDTVRLGAEGAYSARKRVERIRLQAFAKAIGRPLPVLAEDRDMLIGVEVVRGLGEAASSVIAYATEVKHVGF